MTNITGKTKLLGVMGCPIEHSLSPVMHNAALAARVLAGKTLEYVYVPLHIEPGDLETALTGMAALGWKGFNVTIPHKESIMPFLQNISPLAKAVGAVNTVWRQDEGWFGTNTDVQGFMTPLQALNSPWPETEVCILGAGGSARAVITACAQLGCAAIHVVGRNPEKLQSLKRSLWQTDLQIAIEIHGLSQLETLLPKTGLLVNTTPIGMHPEVNATPLPETAIALLPDGATVYDLIYTPRPTRLLRWAKQQGYHAIDGLEMLIHQGAAAFELWVGEPPDITVMRRAALEHLETS